ncbi:hypothetical protein [Zooshikella sp. RANM57]|uniref:hypothetical protein n=1 Tax=Zooshikella sp. RANM57 TaxID=3425863 RepID=UPI003D6F1067
MAKRVDDHPLMVKSKRMVSLFEKMTDGEKASLAEWEKKEVTGDGKACSSDWPGWQAVEDRLSR